MAKKLKITMQAEDQLSKVLEKNNRLLKNLGQTANKAGKNIKEFDRNTKKAGQSVFSFTKIIDGMAIRLHPAVGAVAILGQKIVELEAKIARLTYRGMKAGIESFRELEEEMLRIAQVQLVDLKSVKKLNDGYLKLSRQIPIAASELAKSGVVAAQAGLQGTKGLLGFAKAVGVLSQVTGEKIPVVATNLSKIIKPLNLGAEGAVKFTSAILGVSTMTAATADDLLRAMRRMVPAATALEIAPQALIAMAGAIVGSGAAASRAGTQVNRMLVELAKNSRQVSILMGKGFEDFGNALEQNATKALGDFLNYMEKVQGRTNRLMILTQLFGLTSAKALLPMISNIETYRELLARAYEEMENATSVTEMAATSHQTLSKQLDIINNTFDSIVKTLIQDMSPQLLEVAEDVRAFLEEFLTIKRTDLTDWARTVGGEMKTLATNAVKFLKNNIDDLKTAAINLIGTLPSFFKIVAGGTSMLSRFINAFSINVDAYKELDKEFQDFVANGQAGMKSQAKGVVNLSAAEQEYYNKVKSYSKDPWYKTSLTEQQYMTVLKRGLLDIEIETEKQRKKRIATEDNASVAAVRNIDRLSKSTEKRIILAQAEINLQKSGTPVEKARFLAKIKADKEIIKLAIKGMKVTEETHISGTETIKELTKLERKLIQLYDLRNKNKRSGITKEAKLYQDLMSKAIQMTNSRMVGEGKITKATELRSKKTSKLKEVTRGFHQESEYAQTSRITRAREILRYEENLLNMKKKDAQFAKDRANWLKKKQQEETLRLSLLKEELASIRDLAETTGIAFQEAGFHLFKWDLDDAKSAFENLFDTIERKLWDIVSGEAWKMFVDYLLGPKEVKLGGKRGGGAVEVGSGIFDTLGAIFSAKGNVLPGGFQAFANGSPKVSQPTLGVIGEGSLPEAVVPLPDRRTIPVSLSGATQSSTNVVNAIDPDSINRFIQANPDTVLNLISFDMLSGGSTARAVRGVS